MTSKINSLKFYSKVLPYSAISAAIFFFIIQLIRRFKYPFSGLESFYKAILTQGYISKVDSFNQLLSIPPLYGHPPLMSWLYFIWQNIFGDHFLTLYSFHFLFFITMAVGAYKLSLTLSKSHFISFLGTILFIGNEYVIAHLFDFYYTNAAISCVLWASIFYFKEKYKISAFLCFLAPLILESYIVFSFVFFLSTFKNNKKARTLYFMSPLGLITFYYFQWLHTGSLLSNPTYYIYTNQSFDLLSYFYLMNSDRWSLMKENFISLYPLLAVLIISKTFFKTRLNKELTICSIILFLFYFFINDSPLGRDFFFIYYYVPFIALLSSSSYFQKTIASFLVLVTVGINLISILNLSDPSKETFIPASGHKRARYLKDISQKISHLSNKDQDLVFYNQIVQQIFSKKRYGITKTEYKTTNDFSKVNIIVMDKSYFGHMMNDQLLAEKDLKSFKIRDSVEYRFSQKKGEIKIYTKK